jgi:uncharacterized membrane protein YeaQ/YmgE (transglycosylase-associated protein family)
VPRNLVLSGDSPQFVGNLAGHTFVDSRESCGRPPQRSCQMGIIAFLILGLLAGAIAKAILPGDDPGGIIVTMIIGVVGALLGGFLAGALFNASPLDEFFDLSTWLAAIVGSIILLLVYRLVTGNRGGSRI